MNGMYVVMDKHDKKLLLCHLPELCQSDQPLPLQFSQEELPVDTGTVIIKSVSVFTPSAYPIESTVGPL